MSKRKGSSKEKQRPLAKKRKRSRLQMSDLPMDILHSIVSRLPIRQAARTSILSNHWKHVWCSRTNLKFSFRSLIYKEGSRIPRSRKSQYDFVQRVDAVLRQHSGAGVEKLEVEFFPLHNEHAEHIDRWVKFAIASKTKQLILDFEAQCRGEEPYTFPFQLFDTATGSHLQSMKLGAISLKQPASIKLFLNLKKLELVDVNITDDELKLMLCCCNVLEFIGISRCKLLTRIHTSSHPRNGIKHLQVSQCPLLQGIELHSGLITLEYEGPLMPLALPSTLRNMSIEFSGIFSALAYVLTELPITLRRLETLTLRSEELERATLPNRPLNFLYIRHLRLELNFGYLGFKADVLDLAFLLEAAPVMEKLEIHMLMDTTSLQRYRKCHGFYGQKAQLELSQHILRNSAILKAMKIDPMPTVTRIDGDLFMKDGLCFFDGYKVANKYLRKADHLGVVSVVKVRRRDVENVNPYHLIDPYWIAALTEDQS
ncbi:unnamed protein product [Urochloa decumbens]|uniref:F-box domain-containing protein n=1 Tax=Urochloa decumbens TaxID=240449 RepID=A0ABC9A4P5_9POAL